VKEISEGKKRRKEVEEGRKEGRKEGRNLVFAQALCRLLVFAQDTNDWKEDKGKKMKERRKANYSVQNTQSVGTLQYKIASQ
jgi:hypothetical protein